MPRIFDIVAAGRAYVDIVAEVTTGFLDEHQIPLDGSRQWSVSELNKIQEALLNSELHSGGPSANTAATISALGGKAGFFGKVYYDNSGQHFLADLNNREINLCCNPYADKPELSATCLVLLTHNKRSFAFNPGCGDSFSAADFNEFDFSTTHFFLLEAHLLTSPIAKPAIMQAMRYAAKQTRIVINLHDIKNWDGFTEEIQHILSKADIIIGNQVEQAAFAKTANTLPSPSLKPHLIITTKGEQGADISQSGHLLYHAPAQPSKNFISAAGAGDAFIAGFLLSQAREMNIEESMHYATQTAVAILEEKGARPTRSLAHLIPDLN